MQEVIVDISWWNVCTPVLTSLILFCAFDVVIISPPVLEWASTASVAVCDELFLFFVRCILLVYSVSVEWQVAKLQWEDHCSPMEFPLEFDASLKINTFILIYYIFIC